MSYILEALKKAQAERQLGNSPTIHAPAPSYTPPAAAGPGRRYLLIGLGAGAVVAAAAFLWPGPDAVPPVQVAAAPPPPAAVQAVPAPVAPAPPPAAPAPEPARAEPKPEKPAKSAPARAERDAEPAKPAPKKAEPAPPVAAAPAEPARVAAPAPAPAPASVAAPQPASEEGVRSLQELPEAIQREIPKVAFGGYIYSPNPAERLLLVDKMLRREGEEVAPGLVLERLLPKAAVMNYRGYRYRVAY